MTDADALMLHLDEFERLAFTLHFSPSIDDFYHILFSVAFKLSFTCGYLLLAKFAGS